MKIAQKQMKRECEKKKEQTKNLKTYKKVEHVKKVLKNERDGPAELATACDGRRCASSTLVALFHCRHVQQRRAEQRWAPRTPRIRSSPLVPSAPAELLSRVKNGDAPDFPATHDRAKCDPVNTPPRQALRASQGTATDPSV